MHDLMVFCLEWHIQKSTAFVELLAPIKPHVKIKMIAWDGINFPMTTAEMEKLALPIVFCQLPPTDQCLKDYAEKLVWIPMWDHAKGYSDLWWQSLPRSLRVIAFSRSIAEKANNAGLRCLQLKYYLDPQKFSPVSWNGERTLYYWNRVGMVGPGFLKKLCQVQRIDTLLFLSQVDPLNPPSSAYNLPEKLGKTRVIQLPNFLDREEYLKIISRANITIAPRLLEGVGFTFLEAMAQGCAVFAYDAPTMNEYITHLKNGYLVEPQKTTRLSKLNARIYQGMLSYMPQIPSGMSEVFSDAIRPVSKLQDWQEISQLDLEILGKSARQSQSEGFTQWEKSISRYVEFVLEGKSLI